MRTERRSVEEKAEDRRPCVEGGRASLGVVSGVASDSRIVGVVGGRNGALRRVGAVGVRGHICSDGDGSGSLLSRPRLSFIPSIQRSAWKENSPKSRCTILDKTT